MSSTLNILTKLKELNNSNLVSVFVPSQQKEMSFRQISVKQQKDLMKTGLDGALSGLTISNVIAGIILENSVEKCDFLVSDRIPIILALRKHSLGDVVSIKDENEQTKTYDLDKIIINKLNYTLPYTKVVSEKTSSIKVELSVPTLDDDIKINDFQLSLLKKKKDELEISDTVGSMFVFEVCKFISKITLNGEETDLNGFSVKDRSTVVENLPASINSQILSYLQTFREEETEYLKIDGDQLPIDARLFSKD
jgi:hypothetical protein